MNPAKSSRLRRQAAPSKRGRRNPLLWTAAALCVVLCVLLVAWPALERAVAAAAIASTGARDVRVGAASLGESAWTLGGVHLEDASGTLRLDTKRASVQLDWSDWRPYVTVALNRPVITLDVPSADALGAFFGGAASARPIGRGTAVKLAGATVQVVGLRSEPLIVEDLYGDVRLAGGATTYDLRGALSEGTDRYPFAAKTALVDGAVTGRWSAPAFPLSALGALAGEDGLAVEDGTLSDVAVRVAGATLDGSATLAGGAVTIDGHALRGLAGPLAFDRDEVATAGLAATLGPTQVTLRGVMRRQDLPQLRELFDKVAGEQALQTVTLEPVAPGLFFAKYIAQDDKGLLAVEVLDVDPREPTLRFDTVLADDRIFSHAERTSSMGRRTGAVAGIDGDYFDMGGTSAPQGLMIRDGRLLHSPSEMRETLVVNRDKSFTFGLYHFGGVVTTRRGRAPVTMFNDWPPGQVGIVTPDLGTIPAAPAVTFVALEPAGTPDEYRVLSVAPLAERREAVFGLAFGPLAQDKVPRVGETIRVSYAVTPSVADAVAAVASGPLLLKDGAWYEDPFAPAPGERNVRWPVVAVGKMPNGRQLWVTVDGRLLNVSRGMTRPEFAALLQRFGVSDAIALDSGGSVTMVTRAPGDDGVTVRNHPSDDGGERWVANGLFIYSSAARSPLEAALRETPPALAESQRTNRTPGPTPSR